MMINNKTIRKRFFFQEHRKKLVTYLQLGKEATNFKFRFKNNTIGVYLTIITVPTIHNM